MGLWELMTHIIVCHRLVKSLQLQKFNHIHVVGGPPDGLCVTMLNITGAINSTKIYQPSYRVKFYPHTIKNSVLFKQIAFASIHQPCSPGNVDAGDLAVVS